MPNNNHNAPNNIAFEKELIKLVKQRKCLYQNRSRSSVNNRERLNEWDQISVALNIPVPECKLKWRSLRDRFVREKKKIDTDQVPPPDFDTRPWRHYKDMMFLVPSLRKRRQKVPDSEEQDQEEFKDNFDNSLEEEDSLVSEHFSYDGMYGTAVEAAASQWQLNHQVKEPLTFVVDDDEYDDNQDSSPKPYSTAELQHHDNVGNDFEKYYPIINISNSSHSSNEGRPSSCPPENHEDDHQRNRSRSRKCDVTSNVVTTQAVGDANSVFLELLGSVKTQIDKALSDEKDENDLFLECMAKKMKKLSETAKLRVQAELLQIITKELLRELPE